MSFYTCYAYLLFGLGFLFRVFVGWKGRMQEGSGQRAPDMVRFVCFPTVVCNKYLQKLARHYSGNHMQVPYYAF